MKTSLNWLKRYVDIRISPEELAHRLTMVGLEVESIERLGAKFDGFVVGSVLEVAKHPNADKLSVCRVNVGKDVLQIVCGAPNVAPNQKVAVGLTGATVPRNQHDTNATPFVLSHVKLRGIDSFGMICSAYELGLGEDKEGILVLDAKAKIGVPLAKYLGLDDTVFEIGVTPNRPDAMSHIGIAREVGAIVDKEIDIPKLRLRESKASIRKHASVVVEDRINCPRYTARVVKGIKVSSSPVWLQHALEAIGIRPINNVVDVTNYVLWEIGQPLHAFDYDKLDGGKIIVKCADEGEKFLTLDGRERILNSETLMICDGSRSVAVAGVMGGTNSEISEDTTNILIESAYFKAQSIRRTSKMLGLSTDASQHFERGTDPNITAWAAERAACLIQETCGGEILRGAIDVYPKKLQPRRVRLRVEKVNQVLGTTLSSPSIRYLLGKIEMKSSSSPKHSRSSDVMVFNIPTFRPDIEREIDLVEEVGRIYGYDNIETKTRSTFAFSTEPFQRNLVDEIRGSLIGRGFSEVVANSMQEKTLASLASDKIVEVANPISGDMGALRTSLLPGMLSIVRNNIYHGSKNLRCFEIGRSYFHDSNQQSEFGIDNYVEKEQILAIVSGLALPMSWDAKPRPVDLFDLKGEIESMLGKISLDKFKFIPYSTTKALTRSGLLIEINGKEVGSLGVVQQEILKRFEIEQDVFVAELDADALTTSFAKQRVYQTLPKYPAVARDVAIIVDEMIPVEHLKVEINNSGGELLRAVELFDIYRGDQVSTGKKSCAFALEFLAEDHTMTQEEIDRLMQGIMQHLSNKFQAALRA